MASLLNSAAHMFGEKPYNGKIMATDDSLLAKFSMGEGYHK
jgi:fatty-acid desaturase